MYALLLLNETSPITFGLWLFGIPTLVLYVVLVVFLFKRSSLRWRLMSLVGSLFFAWLGLVIGEMNAWWTLAGVVPLATWLLGLRFLKIPSKGS
ncbi:hypothetical protein SAMN04515668_4648 [Hymenobacter arizonensis]|uniref:Uncharacterized protein n=1 Tax=Hymenobacter arizonensis TaxID=1227077 RepID=A0A1I6BKI5_HYMAR|nr:hypothetical protein SAMN04515668_4648 [Hymenobacter arizonensis]